MWVNEMEDGNEGILSSSGGRELPATVGLQCKLLTAEALI